MLLALERIMVSQQERNRLIEKFKHEPVYAAGVVLKSATCLLLIASIALIGIMTDSPRDDARNQRQAQEHHRAPADSRSAALQERRARVMAEQQAGTPER